MAILEKREFSLEENKEIKSALLGIKSLVIFTLSAIGNNFGLSDIEKAKTIFSGLKKIESVDTEMLDNFDWEKVFFGEDWSSIILVAINLRFGYYNQSNFCEKQFRTLKKYFPNLQILKAVRINEYAESN
ncbi:MAG TPA: hypothetical protein PKZ36_01840 [Candidatus Paceibacterota bacterium]|nr:hypothetical protein [Candidatus Paceibacterota bacterium]HPT18128.1 hypothetical protein [Candidatus Paceibacterota bacterium]